jgi:NADH-quinone oxidoreductase subunit J
VIVYAGAVMVLFVFVIMLLNAGEEERTRGSRVAYVLGIPSGLAGTVIVCWALLQHSDAGTALLGALPGHPAEIAQLLFHQFLLPFEVTSILVLIAIMGAVVLAARPESVQQAKKEE